MRKLLLVALCLTLFSCKGGGGGGSSSSEDKVETKSLFSKWEVGALQWNFTNGQFETNQTMYVELPTTQGWIDALDSAGRDTTGLVAGTNHICELTIYFLGDENSGNIATDHDDIDTPAHNACLEWDNNCVIGVCNYAADHLYTKTGNTLVIDYFGTADSGSYGVDYLE
jgi:hypothetical protein